MNALGAIVVSCLILTAGVARAEELPADATSLVDAERAFATRSVTVSMRDAFLANLADDAILFNPGPVNGVDLWRDRPVSAAVLSWGPSYAEIAAAGDFGFTTGPWEFRPAPGSDPVAFGHFVSVWKKQGGERWKVAVDIGISHEPLGNAPPLAVRVSDGAELLSLDAKRVDAARTALLDADRAFASAVPHGAAAAYRAYGAEDVRLYRDGTMPLMGREAVAGAIGESGGPVMRVTDGTVASSGDLGFTTGVTGTPVAAYYVRIWRLEKNHTWKIVLDIDSAIPADGD